MKPFAFFVLVAQLFLVYPAQAATPNDPLFGRQWYLAKINSERAWDRTTGSTNVVVAVIDTGVAIDHPDLRENIWKNTDEKPDDGLDNDQNGFIDDVVGWNFVERNNDPRPQFSGGYTRAGLVHGTLISSIIAAVGNNAEGITGINWRGAIMPIRALDSSGSGSSEHIIAAIDYAVRNGADIINLSFTTFDQIPRLTEAIRRAKNAGVLVVAAVGNDGSTNLDAKPAYPVCTDGPAGENWVLGVAAVDQQDKKSNFSNYGSLCVDVAAPGEDIFGAQFTGPAGSGLGLYGGGWAGTSVAAPIVSGVAALVRGIAPSLGRSDMIQILRQSVVNIDDLNAGFRGMLGRGRIDAVQAVERAFAMVPVFRESAPQFAVAGESGAPVVSVFDRQGALTASFFAYAPGFQGGVRLATGDIDGDTVPEIITGAGPGGGPHVRIFSSSGELKGQFFAFSTDVRGGITIASADLDNDGKAEIIVGSGKGTSPVIKIFDRYGVMKSKFTAYNSSFTGGVEVATGDIDGDTVSEIITGAGPGGGPHVRIFSGTGTLKGQFFAFENTYRGGVRLATGDIDGGRSDELIAVRGTGTEVRLFSGTGTRINGFPAFAAGSVAGLAPGSFDNNRDGRAEVFVAGRNAVNELRGFTSFGSLTSVFTLPSDLKGIPRFAAFR